MIKTTSILSAAAFTVAALSTTSVSASTVSAVDSFVETGTIYDTAAGSATTVDYWKFNVSTAGTVTIDALAYNVLAGDGANGKSELDTYLHLFAYDANGDQGLLGSQIASNDDSYAFSDGSTSGLDSFLNVSLTAGTYVVAISQYYFSETEARSGTNSDSSLYGGSYGDYQLTFTGIDVASVPLPAAMPLLLAGIGGLGFAARRRKAR